MPLSEQEKRVLDELEAQLAASDPRFASAMSADPVQRDRKRRQITATLGVLSGVAIMAAAFYLKVSWLLAVGLVVLTMSSVAVMFPLTPQPSRRGTPHPSEFGARPVSHVASAQPHSASNVYTMARTSVSPKRKGTSPFMARLEERWERRRRQNSGW